MNNTLFIKELSKFQIKYSFETIKTESLLEFLNKITQNSNELELFFKEIFFDIEKLFSLIENNSDIQQCFNSIENLLELFYTIDITINENNIKNKSLFTFIFFMVRIILESKYDKSKNYMFIEFRGKLLLRYNNYIVDFSQKKK